MIEKKVMFLGLPGTGKTTFLAALWQLVDSSIPGKVFELIDLKGDKEYLNLIRESWLSYTSVQRTLLKEGLNRKAEMKLSNTKSKEEISLIIPDLSGEIFRLALEQRQWTLELDQLIETSTGLVLFVNPRNIDYPQFIAHAQELTQQIISDFGFEVDEIELDNQENSFSDIKPWNPDMIPTQVKLVDLLQLILERKNVIHPIKVSVIISAWDLIDRERSSSLYPSNWICSNLPMLYQYLICHKDSFDTKFYGISAQGGDYEDNSSEELYNITDPAERIIVKLDSEYFHDISLPLAWVTSQ